MAYNYHAITARSHWQVVLDEVKNYLELLCGNHSGGNPIVVVSFPDSHNPTRCTASWRYVSLGMKLIYSNAFHGLKLSMKIVTKYHSRSLKYHTNSQQ